MIYKVYDATGVLLYQGGSWPMARAALDVLCIKDEECPKLKISPEEAKDIFSFMFKSGIM